MKKKLQIAYIGGGSRGWARNIMCDLAKEPRLCGTVKLYDIDFEAAKDNEIIGNAIYDREDIVGKWHYEAVKTLQDALTGSDIVIISILPGTFKEMASDVHCPEKYGIWQPVGDTVGPGGAIRALRTIPMFAEFARAIKQYSPNAWVINYTNPMTVCVRTLYEVFPEIKAFGCCHEVFGTQALLSKIYTEATGDTATRDDIQINVLGINHFTWIDRANCKGTDLFPLYAKFIETHLGGEKEDNSKHWANKDFVSHELVKFDLFRRYGLIAAAGDRHLSEFCPGRWYLENPETVERFGFALTKVEYRVKELEERLETTRKLLSGEKTFELVETGEESVPQICALAGAGDFVTNVNLPNRGQIPNLPLGAVVETNARFGSDSVEPVFAGNLPDRVLNLAIRHVLNQETLVKAGVAGDYELAFSAFLNDPNMPLSLTDARKLFDEMLENTKKYLPAYDKYRASRAGRQ